MKIRTLFFVLLCISPLALAQTIMDAPQDLFIQQTINIEGRIRHVTLEDVAPESGMEIVVYARRGGFPNWEGALQVFSKSKDGLSMEKFAEVQVPKETIYYGFFYLQGISQLILVLPSEIQILPWIGNQWNPAKKLTFALGDFTTPWAKSSAVPFEPFHMVDQEKQIWIPTMQGYKRFFIQGDQLIEKSMIALYPKSFYRTSTDLLPFEMSYWFQNVFWYPKIHTGSLDQKKPLLFSPWMDEVDIVDPQKSEVIDKHYFDILSERERDDGTQYLINEPIDLNGDGRTDFLINKFQGAGTSFQSKSYYYLTDEKGLIPKKGKVVPFPKKKTAGALVRDITLNGKQDFVIVSSILNVWSMIRALTKRQVLLTFDMYLFGKDQKDYNFKKADVTREILFDFSLRDFFIDGVLPTLDGDFDGDGFPDIMYARNPDELTFLIQKPKQKNLFEDVPSGLYNMRLPRKYRIGDCTGDKKADLVFFSTRSRENHSFKVLINNGVLK